MLCGKWLASKQSLCSTILLRPWHFFFFNFFFVLSIRPMTFYIVHHGFCSCLFVGTFVHTLRFKPVWRDRTRERFDRPASSAARLRACDFFIIVFDAIPCRRPTIRYFVSRISHVWSTYVRFLECKIFSAFLFLLFVVIPFSRILLLRSARLFLSWRGPGFARVTLYFTGLENRLESEKNHLCQRNSFRFVCGCFPARSAPGYSKFSTDSFTVMSIVSPWWCFEFHFQS